MILVNLLPQELRLRETKKIHVPYRTIAIGVFSLFILAALYHLFLYVRIREEHRSLKVKWETLAERSAQADRLEAELGATILAEVDFYDRLVDPPLETARVLNLVSDLIPRGAWLTQLKFERNEKHIQLILDGFSESQGKASKLIEIQDFVNGLKNQMEQTLNPLFQARPQMKKQFDAAVTTSSQKGDSLKGETIQFTATFEAKEPEKK